MQEVREAVCRDHRSPSRESSPEEILNAVQPLEKDAYVQLNKDFFVLSSCRQINDMEYNQVVDNNFNVLGILKKKGQVECYILRLLYKYT